MNKMLKNIISFSAALSLISLCGCSDNNNSDDISTNNTGTSDIAVAQSNQNEIKAIFGDIRTSYNQNLDLTDYRLTPNNVPDNFHIKYEAEDAVLKGSCKVKQDKFKGFSDNKYVSGLNKDGDSITFMVEAEYSGFYDFNFVCYSGDSGRVNIVEIDGEKSGEIKCNSDGKIVDSYLKSIFLSEGKHEISIIPYWGYADYDCMILTKSNVITDSTFTVSAELSNKNADTHTKSLYKFLCDIYGKYSLTGQYADEGRMSTELNKIEQATGKQFAVLGLDVMDYNLANKEHGSVGRTIEFAYDWYINAGGIVQFCWHWNSPKEYAVDNSENPWYKSFYKESSKINLDKIMNGKDDKGYQLLMDDIDNISNELSRLRDAGVPIIWRPLHEAAGGWFWWGDCSPESYKKLWNIIYDKMTNEHNLTNLIWMWNGQSADWYPGDDTVDIVAWDIYQGNNVYTSFSGTFAEASECSSENKLIALSENGCVMDPDLVMKDNSRWLFWGTWSDPFTLKTGVILNQEYTETDLLIKAYNHDRTLTLDELPVLKNY